ncbi:hypothetical protein [Stappia sp.]|uniref:hypothetical protein n=1 Tax=Stappia sp. TaxID=1870903 RepID=UPI003C7E0592
MSGLSVTTVSGAPDDTVSATHAAGASTDDVLRFAELRVLAAGCRMRWGLSPRLAQPVPPLSAAERAARLEALLALWDTGCRQALDEDLYRDIAQRNPRMRAAFRERFRP